ncbi:MAG: class II aldolase/adducin family protein [Candidatus Omnitrophica bacterium]|nr:class II aldolase/adducin family protein [Candidatus Omnitrophota bacterium]
MDINQAKQIVLDAGKQLLEKGYVSRTWGNISQRVDQTTAVITPSGREYEDLWLRIASRKMTPN